MTHYRIYDELVESDAPLSYVSVSCGDGSSAWTLRAGQLAPSPSGALIHEQEDFQGGPVLRIYERAHHSVLHYAGWIFDCTQHGVTYTGTGGMQVSFEEVIERVVAPWMVLTRRESVLALHGGAIGHRERALIFMGESGVGKSSAALGLVRRGAVMLSDDMALVDLATMSVLPGAWTLRMWRDGASKATDLIEEGVIVGTSEGKRRFRFARAPELRESVRLVELIELVRDEASSARGVLSQVSGVRALGLVLGQCFDLSHAPEAWRTRRVKLARELVEALGQVTRLSYATSTTGSPEQVDTLWEVARG